MKAAGYFREGARRAGLERSVGDQNQAFLDFCARHGYEVAATFVDTAGAEPPGPGFRQLLQFLQRDGRGFIVVAVDGIGVLGADLGQAAMGLLAIENSGVQVLDIADGSEAAKALIAAWSERADGGPVSQKVRSAMRRRAVTGEVLGRPPYGYRVGARRRLELVPEEAVVVRYIFSLYLQEGLGIRRIAGKLNEDGIATRRGGRWSMVSVRDLLRNRTYLGTYSRFGVKVPGSHAALVSQDDFRKVQERLQANHAGDRKRTVVPYLLSGLAFCGRCGNRMIGVSRRQKWVTRTGEEKSSAYRYYQCESRTNQSACGYNTQRAAELEARLRSMLAEDGSATLPRIARAGDHDAYMSDLEAQVERIETRMRRTRRQVEELVDDAANGRISLERMRALGGTLAEEQQALEAELATIRDRLHAHESEAERRRNLAVLRARVVERWEALGFDELQAALRELVDRLEVDGEEARLYLRS